MVQIKLFSYYHLVREGKDGRRAYLQENIAQNKNLTTLRWEMMDMTFSAKLSNPGTHLQRK